MRIFAIMLVVLIGNSIKAQSLTSAIVPPPGTIYYNSVIVQLPEFRFKTLDTSSVWDYSHIGTYIFPAQPQCEFSGNTNNLIERNTDTEGYVEKLYTISDTLMEFVRFKSNYSPRQYPVNLLLSDPGTYFKFPVTLGDSVYDTFTDSGVLASTYYVVNGHGTLKLPGKTYNNVIGVMRRTVICPSGDTTVHILYEAFDYVSYEWYHPDHLWKIAELVQIGDYGHEGAYCYSSSQLYFQDDKINSINNNNVIVSSKIFPNPATNQTTLNISLAKASKINLSLIDATGQEVRAYNYQGEVGGNNFFLDLTEIPTGFYVLRNNVGGSYSAVKLSVQ